jgi:hypothetical protein
MFSLAMWSHIQEPVENSKAREKTAIEAIDILTDAYQSPAYSGKTMNRIAEMKGIVSCLQTHFPEEWILHYFGQVGDYKNIINVDQSVCTNCKNIY